MSHFTEILNNIYLESSSCESRFWNTGNLCIWNLEDAEHFIMEFEIMNFGIWNTPQGIQNPTSIWNPECVSGKYPYPTT